MKRNYSQITTGGSWTDGKFKSILSPIKENFEFVAKRAHLENRGARRLFSPGNDINPLSKSHKPDEPSTSSSGIEIKNNEIYFSPTSNLPNFVIDGTAPHLLQLSPEKYKENIDWLTRIRKEKFEQKTRKTVSERLASPNSHITSNKRNGRSRSTEPQKVSKVSKSPVPSLLNFFKVAGKDCETSVYCDSSKVVSSTKS